MVKPAKCSGGCGRPIPQSLQRMLEGILTGPILCEVCSSK